MELGAHLPLIEFGDEGQAAFRIRDAAVAARESGFAAVAANDHLLFSAPWLDGPTALASVIEETAPLELATTVALVSVRGPVPLAKALAAIDVLSGGRLVAGVGPGSSRRDYDAVGSDFEGRWPLFEEAVAQLRVLLAGRTPRPSERLGAVDGPLAPPSARPGGIPIWIGSWGSPAGLRRVARLADGWLASAYNTTPERFGAARASLTETLETEGRPAEGFPNGLSTMWAWVTEDRAEADRVLRTVLAPLLKRDPDELATQVCVGGAAHCLELLGRYAEAGCERVYVWPLGAEAAQLELIAERVLPQLTPASPRAPGGAGTAAPGAPTS